MKLDWIEQEQVRMFREREPLKVAHFVSEITVSTVFGPNSEFYREQELELEQRQEQKDRREQLPIPGTIE